MKDLKLAIQVSADTKNASKNVGRLEDEFRVLLASLGKSPEQIEAFLKLARETAAAEGDVEDFERTFEGMLQTMGESPEEIESFRRMKKDIDSGAVSVAELDGKSKALWQTFVKLGAALGAVGFGLLAKSFLDTASQFENFRTQLETTTGSVAAADQAFDWIREFAKTTPYELAGVTEAFVRLKAYGIDPMDGTLRGLGDAAAAMNKPLMSAVEALADAVQGEGERLKEFGIKQRVEGDRMVYTWTDAMGKVRKTIAKNNPAIIRETLLGIWNEKYQGGMNRLSATWSGMWSNLLDTVTGWKAKVMASGPFATLKEWLGEVLAYLGKLEKDGTLAAWASAIGASITTVAGMATSLLKGIGTFVGGITGHFRAVREELARTSEQIKTIQPPDSTAWQVFWGGMTQWGYDTVAVFKMVARVVGEVIGGLGTAAGSALKVLVSEFTIAGQAMYHALTGQWKKLPEDLAALVAATQTFTREIAANGAAMVSGLDQAWKGMVKDFERTRVPALVQATKAIGEAGAAAVNTVKDATDKLSAAYLALGLDMEELETGFTKAGKEGAAALGTVIQAAKEAGKEGDDLAKIVLPAITAALKKVGTTKDLDAVKAAMEQAGLSGEALTKAMEAVKQKAKELGPAAAQAGAGIAILGDDAAKTKRDLDALGAAAGAATEELDALEEGRSRSSLGKGVPAKDKEIVELLERIKELGPEAEAAYQKAIAAAEGLRGTGMVTRGDTTGAAASVLYQYRQSAPTRTVRLQIGGPDGPVGTFDSEAELERMIRYLETQGLTTFTD